LERIFLTQSRKEVKKSLEIKYDNILDFFQYNRFPYCKKKSI
jgi:hypothetical protein